MSEECRTKLTDGIACTRLDNHDGKHTYIGRVDDELKHISWYQCNAVGETANVKSETGA